MTVEKKEQQLDSSDTHKQMHRQYKVRTSKVPTTVWPDVTRSLGAARQRMVAVGLASTVEKVYIRYINTLSL